jgi:methionine-rich copper-binding protein CopC
MTFRLTKLFLTVACLTGLAAPAWAHAHLRASTPSAGARLQTSPTELSMDFTEELEPSFSDVSVTDVKGASVSVGDPIVRGIDGKELSVRFMALLKPGRYRVEWHALSKDGHKTEGNYEFSVAP